MKRLFAAAAAFLAAIASTGTIRAANPEPPRVTRAESDDVSARPHPLRSANDPEFEETERGCAGGRIQDYLERHGDDGVIDPVVLLEMTRDVQRDREIQRTFHTESIAGSVWTPLGPTNGAGRATSIATHPNVPAFAIIGAAGGGVWKTTDSGATWTPLTDSIPNLSVGAIAIAPSDPNIVYLGTGEGGIAADFIPGIGLLSSKDGGKTWTLPSHVIATQFFKISVNPSNPNDLIVGTNAGAMRSSNGPEGPWKTVIDPASSQGASGYPAVTDIVRDPTNPQVMYAATWDQRVWCQHRTCADPNIYASPTILKSTDGGLTWAAANANLPISTSVKRVSRWAIAIAPSSPQTLYAATSIYDSSTSDEVSQIWKTTDGGATWSETSLGRLSYSISHYLGTQSWYDNTIVVNPNDPNSVLAGGVSYVMTTDGGTTWVRPPFSGSPPHVDAHDLRYDASGTLFIANDGGIWTSPDSGLSYVDRNAQLVTRQYYALANDPAHRNRIFGGTQDNGTNRRPDNGGSSWDFFTGGDGIQCAVNPVAPGIVYSTYQFAAINRSFDGGADEPEVMRVTPVYEAADQTPFFSKVLIDATNPSTIYTTTHRVWRSTSGGDAWLPMPTTTTDGSTWSTHNTITAAAISKTNGNVLMVAQNQNVFRSFDGGTTWVRTSSGLPPKNINAIEIDPRNPFIAYVALAGMSGTSVYVTTDGGATWSPRGDGLPPFSAQVVRVDPTDSSTLYCGTDVGVYRSTDAGASWTPFGTGLPAVSVYDIQILNDGSVVRAGTHGRGVWDLAVTGVTNSQPVASISVPGTPQRIARGGALDFTGTISDRDRGDAVTGTWVFPDTWQIENVSTATSTVTHTFERAGTFPVTLAARDSQGAVGAATIEVTVPEPADDCANAIVVPPTGPFPWSVSINTSGSTSQTNDPPKGGSCYPYPIESSVWLTFTPAVTANYQLSTCGSQIGAVVLGYTGDACGPYTPNGICYVNPTPSHDCNVDPAAGVLLTAGVPVRLLVASYYGNGGRIVLTVTQSSVFSPGIESVVPARGSSTGGTAVTITGSGFGAGTSVSFGGIAATLVTVVTPSLLVATVPPHASGAVDVAVTTSAGGSGTLSRAFVYEGGTSSKKRAIRR